jgi:hypothetical protein
VDTCLVYAMALSYEEIMGALEHEFFLAKIKSQIGYIEDPKQLREVIISLVDLIQQQRDTFMAMIEISDDGCGD